jgi:hypothetical protein
MTSLARPSQKSTSPAGLGWPKGYSVEMSRVLPSSETANAQAVRTAAIDKMRGDD